MMSKTGSKNRIQKQGAKTGSKNPVPGKPGQASRAKTATSAFRTNNFLASGATTMVIDDESYFPLIN